MTKGTHSYIEDERNKHIKIYVNGNTHSRNKAVISVFDSGFLLGDGIWESIRYHNGHICFIDEHLDRLYSGAKKISLTINKSKKELIDSIHSTLDKNKMYTEIIYFTIQMIIYFPILTILNITVPTMISFSPP